MSAIEIPRCLHFIWLDEPIPPGRQECIDSCVRAHPDYDVRIWRSVEEFGSLRNQRVFDEADAIAPLPPRGNPHQVRTNVLRFEIMLRHGGVFLDSDVHCLRSIEPLVVHCERAGKAGALAWEIQDRWLGEAVIVAAPGARFMERVVANLERWAFARARRPATITVGPQYITPTLRGTAALREVSVLPQRTFFPARHDQPELGDAIIAGDVPSPGTYLVHRFGNFRRRQGTPL